MTEEPPVEPRHQILQTIWEGMPVVDRDGALVGAVKYVQGGAPLAAEVDNEKPFAEDNLNEAFARALTSAEPQVSAPAALELIRGGFLKVTGAGLMDHDRYVAADQIACADEDIVRLTVRGEQLVVKRQRWI